MFSSLDSTLEALEFGEICAMIDVFEGDFEAGVDWRLWMTIKGSS